MTTVISPEIADNVLCSRSVLSYLVIVICVSLEVANKHAYTKHGRAILWKEEFVDHTDCMQLCSVYKVCMYHRCGVSNCRVNHDFTHHLLHKRCSI